LFVQVFQDPADLLASLSIQVPGRLVGEEISGLLAGYYQANSVKTFQAVAALFA
jgi:hypothetical protein